MLSMNDYVSLKSSVKGWTARKLASYGVAWPPVEGWRKRLLREYESAHPVSTRSNIRAVVIPHVKTLVKPERAPRWKKLRPDSNDELEGLLQEEKHLTAYWYARISGQVPWKHGQREQPAEQMDAMSGQVNALMFASLPDE